MSNKETDARKFLEKRTYHLLECGIFEHTDKGQQDDMVTYSDALSAIAIAEENGFKEGIKEADKQYLPNQGKLSKKIAVLEIKLKQTKTLAEHYKKKCEIEKHNCKLKTEKASQETAKELDNFIKTLKPPFVIEQTINVNPHYSFCCKHCGFDWKTDEILDKDPEKDCICGEKLKHSLAERLTHDQERKVYLMADELKKFLKTKAQRRK